MLIQPQDSGSSVGPMEPLGPIQPQPMPETQIQPMTIEPAVESGQAGSAKADTPAEEPSRGGISQVGFLSRLSGSGQKDEKSQPVEPKPRRGWFSPLFR